MDDPKRYLDAALLAKVRGLELQARLIVEGYLSGMHKSPYHGFSVEFAQHREYVPGDDIKHIDWKVYGRTGRFYLKQYEEETNLICWLIVDVSESMRYGSGEGQQVRLRLHVGGGAGLPDPRPARQRRPGHLRRPGPPVPEAVEPAVAPEGSGPRPEPGAGAGQDADRPASFTTWPSASIAGRW